MFTQDHKISLKKLAKLIIEDSVLKMTGLFESYDYWLITQQDGKMIHISYTDPNENDFERNELVERIQSLCGKSYLKLIHFVCPMIYYRMFVDFGNILIYPFFQFLFGIDTDALQTLLPHLSKETFNQVQP